MDKRTPPFSGARLAGYRHARGFTQNQLGNAVGRSQYTQKGYESGDRVPPRDVEASLCVQLDIPYGSLRSRFDRQPAADYFDAVADALGLRLAPATILAAAEVFAHVDRVRGRVVGNDAA